MSNQIQTPPFHFPFNKLLLLLILLKVAEYALACQTYEGGFAGEPGAEAHGG